MAAILLHAPVGDADSVGFDPDRLARVIHDDAVEAGALRRRKNQALCGAGASALPVRGDRGREHRAHVPTHLSGNDCGWRRSGGNLLADLVRDSDGAPGDPGSNDCSATQCEQGAAGYARCCGVRLGGIGLGGFAHCMVLVVGVYGGHDVDSTGDIKTVSV